MPTKHYVLITSGQVSAGEGEEDGSLMGCTHAGSYDLADPKDMEFIERHVRQAIEAVLRYPELVSIQITLTTAPDDEADQAETDVPDGETVH